MGFLEILLIVASGLIGYRFNRNRSNKHILIGVIAGIAGAVITGMLLTMHTSLDNLLILILALVGAVVFSYLQVKILK